ncbi:tannase/feruloyl esterase family alpha/beta hydrolase [Variovorax paradoxus]|uniref:tannase/feruloyl esterase family alpha/beta hydrolase n=1 Tax=Variovorax paradoxus TaxID=34073 RepID=UPI003D653C1B
MSFAQQTRRAYVHRIRKREGNMQTLDQWMTKSKAPSTLVAEKRDAQGAVVLSRPLCQYPQYPRYTGPANDAAASKSAANYTCSS